MTLLRDTGMTIAQLRDYAELLELGGASVAQRLVQLEQRDAEPRSEIASLRSRRRALGRVIERHRADLGTRTGDER